MRKFILGRLLAIVVAVIIGGVYYMMTSTPPKDVGKILTQGELDIIFKGTSSKEYKDIVVDNMSEQEINEKHSDYIQGEIDYFFKYFYLDEDYKTKHMEELKQIFENIYSKAKYNISDMQEKDGVVTAFIDIEPINIIRKFDQEFDSITEAFFAEIDSGKINLVTDEEKFAEFSDRAVKRFIELSKEPVEYDEKRVITVRIPKDSEGFYQVNSDDLSKALEEIVPYK